MAAGYSYEGVAYYAMSTSTGGSVIANPPVSSDLARAQTALQAYINKCPNYLTGATVSIDASSISASNIAVAYYTSKRIIINPNWDAMTASTLENIVNHETWHILDFAIDSRIDWGEYVPPTSTAWPACMR